MALGVRLAVAALVKSVFINVQSNMTVGVPEGTWAYF